MKLSKAEWAAICLAGGFLLFFTGWYLRGASAAGSYTVSAQHPPIEVSAAPQETFVPDELLDLNTARLEDLDGLPGIGTVRAQAILDYRDEHGPFRHTEDLTAVPGIGQATYELLAPYVTVKEVDAP